MATEAGAFAKEKFGQDHPLTLDAVTSSAVACACLGRVEEAKVNIEDVLTTQTRVLGRDHPKTQETRRGMCLLGFAVPG